MKRRAGSRERVCVSTMEETSFIRHNIALQDNVLDYLGINRIKPMTWLIAGAAVALAFYIRERIRAYRDSLPSYKDIPKTILSHMASRQELESMSGNIDIAIVGSGVGALFSAAILSKCGYKVAVFEQHSIVGGSTHMYKTNGYEFDVGVHYIGGCMDSNWSSFRLLFDFLTDGMLQWNRIAECYDIAYNNTTGERLEFTGDPKWNRKSLLNHFPSCADAIDNYYRKCRNARIVAYVAFGLKCFPPAFTKVIWKLGFGSLYKRVCLERTMDVMRSCGLPDQVIGAITYNYGDYGTPPKESPFFIQAFMDSHYHGGAFFPKGGSTSIAKTLVAAIKRDGGKVFAASPVEHILTRKTWKGHATTGVRIRGTDVMVRKAVISDAGFIRTFEVDSCGNPPLVDQLASASQLHLIHNKDITSPFHPSLSFCYLFVGFDGTDEELRLPGQNVWHVQDWNHDDLKKRLFEKSDISEALKENPPLVFLSLESAKDPDYATRHPGKATATLIAWANPKWFEPWQSSTQGHRGKEYNEIKSEITDALLSILYKHYPLTKGRVAFAELGTPLSAKKYLGRTCGEIYNLDHNAERFGSLEAQLALHPETTVENLFLTGQDVVGVSIEGATLGGLFTAARVSTLAFAIICLPAALACFPWACGLIV